MITNRQARATAPEHEFEAALGLPEPLPRGERLLWQGAPDWRVMAREAMHLRIPDPATELCLPARHDPIGRAAHAAFEELRAPLKGPLERSVASVLQSESGNSPP